MRRIGVLMNLAADGPAGRVRLGAFLEGLQQLGWTDGRNVRIDARGQRAIPVIFANTPRNWWRSDLTSSWLRCASCSDTTVREIKYQILHLILPAP